ncbi:hypothetical protein CDG76_28910 [Nostoc sp. 'Peltigera membranacea cyanobiont' 210A]|nr:hypothetical protein CDG76_28910 [Nostoc sp. 'Peltigera membranacea cyanobiont' 210A]
MGETPKTALAPLNPLPALREGRQSVALAGVGFFRFNKQLSGHDITQSLQRHLLQRGEPAQRSGSPTYNFFATL